MLKKLIPVRIRQVYANIIDTNKLRYRYYNEPEIPSAIPMIVYMCDGRLAHGGLSDRLSGLISTYDYCKTHNRIFKVNWDFPYKLEEFLEPNNYDWRVQKEELSFSKHQTSVLRLTIMWDIWKQRKYANRYLGRHQNQVHLYTNMKYFFPCNFKYLFQELFKPSPLLENAIQKQLLKLNGDYVSITFRFQQLLGDFKEGHYPTLKNETSRKELINKCLKYIEFVKTRHPEVSTILVTSDSVTFLKAATTYNFVHVIPGKVVHVDNDGRKSDKSIHLKSFIDLFLIAHAKKIYNVIIPPLYHTTFPMLASFIYGHEYEELSTDLTEVIK
ncbi:MAG: hypothetical protein K2G67_05075 [Muribaculaceae bacterium]|nr:hypothetical protein [Muribaculaceae bacterium]